MNSDDLRPKQLRALLLLLFLVPLIPTAMMARLMFESLRGERSLALERQEAFYSATLSSALAGLGSEPEAESIVGRVRQFADGGVSVRLLDEKGTLVAGDAQQWGAPVAQALVPGHPGWQVLLHLSGPELLDASVAEQQAAYLARLGFTTLAVLAIAGVAVLAIRRQLALQELKSSSVATVAHELRTPIATVRMLVDTLREGRYRTPEKLAEYLALISSESERLSRLAENFLTFSRLDHGAQALHFETIAPGEVAAEAVKAEQLRLAGADFAFHAEEPLPHIRADRAALAAALGNLLDNALKYTGAEKRIRLHIRARDGSVEFAVEDNGIGIPERELRAVFRPFYQADQRLSRTREGCGLGLALVRRTARAHGGDVRAESTPGQGSTFTLHLRAASSK